MAEERRAVHCYLSLPGHAALHRMAEDNGISLSAWMEVIAVDYRESAAQDGLDDDGEPVSFDGVLPKETVRAARKIDAERRRRG